MNLLFTRSAHKISGAEIYNLNLLQEFAKQKDFQISFISDNPELLKRINGLGVSSFLFPLKLKEVGTKRELLKAILILPLFVAHYLRLRRDITRSGGIDAWVLQSRTEKLFLTPILKCFGCTIVWIEHGPYFASQSSDIVKVLFRFMSKFIKSIIAVSQDTKADLVKGGVSADKIHVLYIGVDTNRLKPLVTGEIKSERKRLGIPTGKTVIGYLGNMGYEKGIDDFLTIASLMLTTDTSSHFLVIGDGPELGWAITWVKKKKIPQFFTFTGYVSHPEQYLGLIDILLFPTKHREGISMALLEAQAMGKTVVTTNIGGNSEIITHGKNGYLYPAGDNKKGEMYITRLSRAKTLCRILGNQARKNTEERFNIKKQAQVFYKYFKQL